jgi:hypothetical protein
MKTATNIPQQTLTKTLKILEQRNLVKFVRAVTSKSKKLYMLYDMIPAKDITGGPWYTDQVLLRDLGSLDMPFHRSLIMNLLKSWEGSLFSSFRMKGWLVCPRSAQEFESVGFQRLTFSSDSPSPLSDLRRLSYHQKKLISSYKLLSLMESWKKSSTLLLR